MGSNRQNAKVYWLVNHSDQNGLETLTRHVKRVARKKTIAYYLVFFSLVMVSWLTYMLTHNGFALYEKHWVSAVTMIVGAFVGSATSEGGGAIAYPVFTLILHLPSPLARNFAFAIQSVGMVGASMLIIGLRVPIDWKAIGLVTIGGIPGLFLGLFYLAPLIASQTTKIIFVSLWLSFSVALFLANRRNKGALSEQLEMLVNSDRLLIILFGFIGGIITSVFGDGVNVFTFCLFTLYYRLNIKVATPTSVVIMSIHTVVGFLSHVFLLDDFQPLIFNYWICAAPVALIMAPAGAYLITFLDKKYILWFLYVVTVVQYVGALFVIRPGSAVLMLSVIVLATGSVFFIWISRWKRNL